MNKEKILVIGSKGQLGSDLLIALQDSYQIIELNHTQFQLEDKICVGLAMNIHKPDYVINTAAYHNPQLCEENPQEAFLINATALKYLSHVCNENNVTLIHFSTDYVFGKIGRSEPYHETDFPYPIQIYGMSKLAGEQIVQQYCDRYYLFRTSGLYGLKGSTQKKYKNYVEMMIQLGKEALENKKALPCAMDQHILFNPTHLLAATIHQFLQHDHGYGLYHLTCDGESTRLQFVRELFKQLKMEVNLFGVPSSYFKPTYAQPLYSILSNDRLQEEGIKMPTWVEGLQSYLRLREGKI